MIVHYTHPYVINPGHKLTVELVGLGGTGSQMLNNLGRMNVALMGLGHPGLHIRAWDPDIVTEFNMGRQIFSPADMALNKAVVLVSRVNRFFGTDWEAINEKYTGDKAGNIIITCVDTAKGRIAIQKRLIKKGSNLMPIDTEKCFYWMDLGNLKKTGQCILGTVQKISQPASEHMRRLVLPDVVKFFPQLKRIKEKDQGPSCSLAEALDKQDLFINSTLAQFGCNLLWKLIREGMIKYQGCYVNLETLSVNPIKIK